MTKTSSPSLIGEHLQQGGLSRLLQQVEHYQRCQSLVQELLPAALKLHCSVLGITPSGTLKLGVSSAAIATKVRQILPRIQQHLVSHQWEINEITLKIQTSSLSASTRESPHRQFTPGKIGQQGLHAFKELQSNVKKGELADAITRLLNRRKDNS